MSSVSREMRCCRSSGQVLQRPHVVEPVGELHQDDPDVVDHGQEHLPVRLGLALLGGGERDLRDLGDALHDVEHVGAEVLLEPLGGGEGVLEDVVEEADRDADGVHPHLGQDRGHLEGVHEVGLARGADLPLVLDRREDVRLAEDLEVGVGVVALDRLLDVLEADHGLRNESRDHRREGSNEPSASLTPVSARDYNPLPRSPFVFNDFPGRRPMRTRYRAPVLAALLPLVLLSVGCNLVKAKAAFKDGNRLYKEENYRKAIDEYEKAVQLKPDFAEAHFYLASSHQSLYRPGKEGDENRMHLDKAIEHYEKALELNKGDTPNLQQLRLNTLGALTAIYSEPPLSNYEKALGYAEQLVKDNPNDIKNLYAMANLYEKFGRVAEAEQTYEKVGEQNPKDAKACGALAAFYNKPLWDEKGEVWVEDTSKGARRAKFDTAIATLDRCADIDPTDPSGHYKLAMFYWDKAYRDPLLGDKEKNEYADKGIETVNSLARGEARLLGGDHHEGPALPREGPGGHEPGRPQAVPRPGGAPPEAGDGPAQGVPGGDRRGRGGRHPARGGGGAELRSLGLRAASRPRRALPRGEAPFFVGRAGPRGPTRDPRRAHVVTPGRARLREPRGRTRHGHDRQRRCTAPAATGCWPGCAGASPTGWAGTPPSSGSSTWSCRSAPRPSRASSSTWCSGSLMPQAD